MKHKFYRQYGKRCIDVILALIAIIVLSPVFLVVSLLIKIDSKGSVMFKQERLGVNGKTFEILKFRSMIMNAEHTGSGVYSGKNDSRVTAVGKFLRASSLDEIPQFINILKGDMSFIATSTTYISSLGA